MRTQWLLGFVLFSIACLGQNSRGEEIFKENFDGTFNNTWSWIREDSDHWSVNERPGFLRIRSQLGDIWSIPNDAKNLLVRDLPAGDIQVTIRFQAEPVSDFQQVAVYIYEDGDNYVKNALAYASYRGGLGMHLGKDINDFYLSQSVVVPQEDFFYVRLTKEGNTYTGHYSFDGTTWTQNGRYEGITIHPTLVGLGAWNSKGQTGPVGEMIADIDWFEISSVGSVSPTPTPTPQNLPPSVPVVSIRPEAPNTLDDLLCDAQGSVDPEGATVTYLYQWFEDGESLENETSFSLHNSLTLRDRLYECVVTPSDGVQVGPAGASSVRVLDTPPTAPVVKILPENPIPGDGMAVYIQVPSEDIDGDTILYLFEWFESQDGENWIRRPELSGNLSPFFPGEPEVSSLYIQIAEHWRVDVTPIEAHTVAKKGEASEKGSVPIVGNKGTSRVIVSTNLIADGLENTPEIVNAADLLFLLSNWHKRKMDMDLQTQQLFFSGHDQPTAQVGTRQFFYLALENWYKTVGE